MKKINYDQFFFNSLNELKIKGLDRYLKTLIKIDPIKILEYEQLINSLSLEVIQQASRDYLNTANYVKVVLYPEVVE